MKKVSRKKEESVPEDPLAIASVEDISKLTIEEAVQKGILPTPIELAKTSQEIIEYGKTAGITYGQAFASLTSAFRRRDLPFQARMAKGIRGLSALLAMVLSAVDQYEKLTELEEKVLTKAEKGELSDEKSDIEKLIEILEESGLIKSEEDKKKIMDKIRESNV